MKAGDDTGNVFRRIPSGLVDRVLAPSQSLDLKTFVTEVCENMIFGSEVCMRGMQMRTTKDL
jgi:hypothetical protein